MFFVYRLVIKIKIQEFGKRFGWVFYTLISADIWERFDTKIDTHTTYTKNKNTLKRKSVLRDHFFWLQNVVVNNRWLV